MQPFDIGLSISRAPPEYKAFMVAYLKTPSLIKVRTKRAVRKKTNSYFDYDRYNPYRKLWKLLLSTYYAHICMLNLKLYYR